MRHTLSAMAVAVVATLATGAVADAQTITITTPNFAADDLGKTIEPKGTFIYPKAGVYTVKFDVGYFNKDGKYVADATVAPQKQANPVLLDAKTGGNDVWSATGPVTLTNPGAGLYLRAVLYMKDANDVWQPVDETFTLVNP